jgi:hypothetical protein
VVDVEVAFFEYEASVLQFDEGRVEGETKHALLEFLL